MARIDINKLKAARHEAAHRLAQPISFWETVVHGFYFGGLFFEQHAIYVMCGGVLLGVIVVRVVVGVME